MKQMVLSLFLFLSLSLQAQAERRDTLMSDSLQTDSVIPAKPSAFKRAIRKFMNFSDFDTLYISPNRYNYALMTTHFSNFEYYSVTSNLKAYLFRVVRNNCLHYRRDQQIGRAVCEKIRQKEAGLMEYYTRTIESCDPNELFTTEILTIYKEQVEQMPDITKQVFTLKTEGRSYKEIADILHISIRKVDKELQKATAKLRESLKDYLSVLVVFFTLLEK